MDTTVRRPWVRAVLLVAAVYTVVGIVFTGVQLWRLAAWAICAAVGAAHILYEQFRLGHAPRVTALHAAAAVALGALGLAIAANIHELGSATSYRPRLLIALVAWPLVTAVPAFVLALAAATGLRAMRRAPG